jgi:hypothetical protein
MIRMIFAAGAAFVFLGFGLQPAGADFYGAPWCAVMSMGDGDMQWDCEYRSIEECRPNVLSGNRGWCNPNPYSATSYAPAERQRHRKRHVSAQ